mgnify:CR=1 FL=1
MRLGSHLDKLLLVKVDAEEEHLREKLVHAGLSRSTLGQREINTILSSALGWPQSQFP